MCKVDRTDKMEKSTELLTECCQSPHLVRAWWDKPWFTTFPTSHLYDNRFRVAQNAELQNPLYSIDSTSLQNKTINNNNGL